MVGTYLLLLLVRTRLLALFLIHNGRLLCVFLGSGYLLGSRLLGHLSLHLDGLFNSLGLGRLWLSCGGFSSLNGLLLFRLGLLLRWFLFSHL